MSNNIGYYLFKVINLPSEQDHKMADDKFLQQDRMRRFQAAREKEAAAALEQKQKLIKKEECRQKINEYEKAWMNFFDGKAMTKSMWFIWAHDKYFLLMFVDPATDQNYPYHYVWSDPGYPGGDNTIRPFKGTVTDWYRIVGVPVSIGGRYKGQHILKNYCGPDVKYVAELFTKRDDRSEN